MSTSFNEFDTIWAPPGKAIDDGGVVHDSVQAAHDNASAAGHMMVGPGTFEETLNITKSLTVRGAGVGTVIDPGEGHGIVVDADNVTVEALSARNTPNTGQFYNPVRIEYPSLNINVNGVRVLESDGSAFNSVGVNVSIIGCHVEASDTNGFSVANSGINNLLLGNTTFEGVTNNAINLDGDRAVAVGNAVRKAGDKGIADYGTGNTIGFNIVDMRDVTPTGVYLDGSSSNVTVMGNRVTGDGVTHDYTTATDVMAFGNQPLEMNTIAQNKYDPVDVRAITAPTKGVEAYHDPSVSGDANTEGPAFYNGAAWVSQVDGSTIS